MDLPLSVLVHTFLLPASPSYRGIWKDFFEIRQLTASSVCVCNSATQTEDNMSDVKPTDGEEPEDNCRISKFLVHCRKPASSYVL